MLTRSEKDAAIASLRAELQKASAVFLTNLIGVTANDSARVRKAVRTAKGKIVITRNKLIEKAAEGTSAAALLKDLKGPNAVALAYEDGAPGVAKALNDVGSELELITLKAGVLDGKLLSQKDVQALAKLPSRDQMLATLLATFNAPASAFVRVIDAIRTKKEAGEITA